MLSAGFLYFFYNFSLKSSAGTHNPSQNVLSVFLNSKYFSINQKFICKIMGRIDFLNAIFFAKGIFLDEQLDFNGTNHSLSFTVQIIAPISIMPRVYSKTFF